MVYDMMCNARLGIRRYATVNSDSSFLFRLLVLPRLGLSQPFLFFQPSFHLFRFLQFRFLLVRRVHLFQDRVSNVFRRFEVHHRHPLILRIRFEFLGHIGQFFPDRSRVFFLNPFQCRATQEGPTISGLMDESDIDPVPTFDDVPNKSDLVRQIPLSALPSHLDLRPPDRSCSFLFRLFLRTQGFLLLSLPLHETHDGRGVGDELEVMSLGIISPQDRVERLKRSQRVVFRGDELDHLEGDFSITKDLGIVTGMSYLLITRCPTDSMPLSTNINQLENRSQRKP
jgi:hypothetical protein